MSAETALLVLAFPDELLGQEVERDAEAAEHCLVDGVASDDDILHRIAHRLEEGDLLIVGATYG